MSMLTIDNETTLESFKAAFSGNLAFSVETDSPEGLETYSLSFPWMVTNEFLEELGESETKQKVSTNLVENGVKDIMTLLFDGDASTDGTLLGILDGIRTSTDVADDTTIAGTLEMVDAGRNVFLGPNTGTLVVDLIGDRTPDGESINVPMNLAVASLLDEKEVFVSDGPLGTLYLIDIDDNEELQAKYMEEAEDAVPIVKRLTFGFVKGEVERYHIRPE